MNKILALLLIIFSFKASSQVNEALTVADSLYALGDYSNAIRVYKKTDPSEKQLLYIAKSYGALGNKISSLEYYDQYILKYSAGSAVQYEYAKLLANTGANKKADSIYKDLISKHPLNPNYYFQRGLLFEKKQDSIAHELFLQTFTLDSTHLNAAYKIAKYQLTKRKFEEAQYCIDLGLKNNPISRKFLNLKALLLYYTKDFHGAISAYQVLIEQQVNNVQLHEHLAFSYGKTYQFVKAIEHFTILINEYDDKKPSYHYNIGKSFMGLANFEKGRHHVEMSIALQEIPLDAQYLTLAISYSRQGKFKETMRYLRKALEENSENEFALYQLAVAADNYYTDEESVMLFYENYIKRYLKDGSYLKLAQSRVSEIKKELHFNSD
jgi:Flp pilus assembly protein TadD